MASSFILVRHGETEWSRTRRHTSFTDLSLTAQGRDAAASLVPILGQWSFAAVFSSPRKRALETAQLALPGRPVSVTGDLAEWNYGDYEGLTSAHIHEKLNPEWDLWNDGGPHGERPDEVAARVDRVIAEVDRHEGDVCAFAHGHVLRVLAARWIGLPPAGGRLFRLDTATVSVLGYEHGRRVIASWNARGA